VQDLPEGSLTVQSATADKGYYAVKEMSQLQQEGIKTVISDPIKNRKLENLSPEEADAVRQAKRSSGSKSGKKLLKKRGMHLERSFAHLLDAGGARRTTLQGLENLNKRFKLAAAIYNLSQLMRQIWGVGTPKQWAAGVKTLAWMFYRLFVTGWSGLVNGIAGGAIALNCYWEQTRTRLAAWVTYQVATFSRVLGPHLKKNLSSTGC